MEVTCITMQYLILKVVDLILGSEHNQSTFEVVEPAIKVGPPKGKKRKANNALETSPRKKRRFPSYTSDDDSRRFRVPPAPRRDVSEESRLSPSVDDISARAVSAHAPYKCNAPTTPQVQKRIPSRSPSSSPSLQHPEDSPEDLHDEPLEDSPEDTSEEILEDNLPPPPSPSPLPRAPSPLEDDDEEEQKSLLHEMEKSYLNLDPRQSPISPVRLPLRESQQEVVEETVRICIILIWLY